ncbi:hypothetical protein [Nonomuraea longispora]|uniref:TetR/AcrR family transcriptional regulator n=1 Tax=Nonomuraea longispora TaxID=1848320 RepID=UPI00140478BD
MTGGPERAPVRTGPVSAQILGMALCRYVLAFPPLAALTSEEVVEAIGPAVHRHLCLGA